MLMTTSCARRLARRPSAYTARPAMLVAVAALAALGACSGDEVIDPPFPDNVVPRVQVAKGKGWLV